MNEQEKALQGMIEFCQWLIPNAKQLGLEQSKSIAMISQAQTPQDLMKGVDSLYQELGEDQFKALAQAFQKSKSQNIKMAKKGAKIDYLVNKFANGGPYSWVPKGDLSVETPEGIVTYKTTDNEIVNMHLKMHDGRTVGAVIRNGQFIPVILPNLRNPNEAIPLTGRDGQEVAKMMETLYNSHVIPHEKQRYLYEYNPSYSIEGPRDSRIQTIVQNDYPHRSITRVNDNGNYIYQGDSFGPASILNQDSLANVWNTLYKSPRTKKNK